MKNPKKCYREDDDDKPKWCTCPHIGTNFKRCYFNKDHKFVECECKPPKRKKHYQDVVIGKIEVSPNAQQKWIRIKGKNDVYVETFLDYPVTITVAKRVKP